MVKAVDVFHFSHHHKGTDEHCEYNANPFRHDILFAADGSWGFNSSAAEMVNSWVSRYYSCCLNMRRVEYDFFLDVMVDGRNAWHQKALEQRGLHPCTLEEAFDLGCKGLWPISAPGKAPI